MSDSTSRPTTQQLAMLGLRAQATAAGLVQLCIELQAKGVLDQAAVENIKEAIAEELTEHAPRSTTKQLFLSNVRTRLDKIFSGAQPVGPLPFEAARDATTSNGSEIGQI